MHSIAQQVFFLSYINQVLDDKHIRLGIRELLKGQPINVKKSLEFLPSCTLSEDEAQEMLGTYKQVFNLNNKYLDNAETRVKGTALRQLAIGLNTVLVSLGLPTVNVKDLPARP